ncbi:molybdopterin cofactor-binding domain-containing protein [Streptomyces sp. CB01881]|uniref:xanthine dehydrogenase family protein molybdopterin-binding subunit n=1 Tax=Streptomyces sp. CB01881 TaxID=2078691 RepID=UPI000CDC4FD2|nr:molybdopterin cofactor-binding domain-containing protein [Streptomyces sp. CB01881]AUY48149.1 isoquinoline 1-oxidoreductase [Streptomyces sp. CB01881]TYC76634.1 xanthine dehydrogenase family protein molybdopterin-binding subunit [Streptomyces sp. CB01881]
MLVRVRDPAAGPGPPGPARPESSPARRAPPISTSIAPSGNARNATDPTANPTAAPAAPVAEAPPEAEAEAPAVSPADGPAAPTGRRRFLTYLLAAPTLTVAARLGLDAAAPATAQAAVQTAAERALAEQASAPSQLIGLPGIPDILDPGDALIVAGLPTSHLLVLEVTADGRAALHLPRLEVGQGLTTAIAMLVAEELDARLTDVDVPLADGRPELLFNQLTGASNSVRSLYDPVRAAAAAARARLVTAAARRWSLPAGTLRTADSAVLAPDGRRAGYGELAAEAAGIAVPAVPAAPKPPDQQRLVGRPTGRIDARDIVTGRAKYAGDLAVPGAVPCVVARPTTINGTLRSLDASAARAMPGVLGVFTVPTGVAVLAETFDQALKARDALLTSWHPGPVAALSDADIRARLRAAHLPFLVPPLLTQYVDSEFDFAFVNHAPMEVLTAVADVRPNRAELWFASQTPIVAQQTIAAELGLPQDAVTVHVVRGGGSFGRRLFFDAALEAARISRAAGRPVKLMWTRNDDMRHGRMRPASHHRVRATYGLGQVISYEHRVATVRTDFRHGLGEALTAAGFNLSVAGISLAQAFFLLSEKNPYDVGIPTQLLAEVPLDMHTGSWRSVYSGTVRVADEIMMDELARRLGQDPVAFRRARVRDAAGRAVLDKVAQAGRWGRPMPAGQAQGIGYHDENGGRVAYLVELDATDPKQPRATRAVIAADLGLVINPRGLEAQLTGALIDGISVVLQAGNHIDRGAVREGSFADFRYARQRNSPPSVEIHLMPPSGAPGGAGELGVPAASAAVANAYARATGTSPRSFPIDC